MYILCLFYANFEVNAWIRKKHIFYAKYLLLYVYLPHLLSNKTDHHDITDILLTVALNTPSTYLILPTEVIYTIRQYNTISFI